MRQSVESLNFGDEFAPLLSIVTTIDLARRPEQLIERLRMLHRMAMKNRFRLVIGHNDRGTRHDAALRAWHSGFVGSACTLVTRRFYDGQVNNACLRNAALSKVATPLTALIDVDIHTDPETIRRLGNEVAVSSQLAMVPCMYLTEAGSKFLLADGDASVVIDDYFSYRRKYVMHVAMPSSVIAFRTEIGTEIGGFDESYTGHGYEDFDFILRLALKDRLISPSRDLLIDRTYTAPLLAEGFRAQLGLLCLKAMIEKRFAFHLFHWRDNNEQYYRMREINRSKFQSRVNELIKDASELALTHSPPLIDPFFNMCSESGRSSSDYFAYFDARPGHLVRNDRIRRIIRKFTGQLPC